MSNCQQLGYILHVELWFNTPLLISLSTLFFWYHLQLLVPSSIHHFLFWFYSWIQRILHHQNSWIIFEVHLQFLCQPRMLLRLQKENITKFNQPIKETHVQSSKHNYSLLIGASGLAQHVDITLLRTSSRFIYIIKDWLFDRTPGTFPY